MISMAYAPKFVRQYKKLDDSFKQEIKERIALFKKNQHNPTLDTHKLHGELAGKWAFSINYKDRIVFRYLSSNEVILLVVDDHDIYKKR